MCTDRGEMIYLGKDNTYTNYKGEPAVVVRESHEESISNFDWDMSVCGEYCKRDYRVGGLKIPIKNSSIGLPILDFMSAGHSLDCDHLGRSALGLDTNCRRVLVRPPFSVTGCMFPRYIPYRLNSNAHHLDRWAEALG